MNRGVTASPPSSELPPQGVQTRKTSLAWSRSPSCTGAVRACRGVTQDTCERSRRVGGIPPKGCRGKPNPSS